jgi:predicted nucleotidyltransferase component of viral defense system
MKIEISKRGVSGAILHQTFLGESVLIMKEEDLFANKLIALLHRSAITNRDIFDIWFFLQKGVSWNKDLITQRIGKNADIYMQEVKAFIQ